MPERCPAQTLRAEPRTSGRGDPPAVAGAAPHARRCIFEAERGGTGMVRNPWVRTIPAQTARIVRACTMTAQTSLPERQAARR